MKPRRLLLKNLTLCVCAALALPLLGGCDSAAQAAPQSRFVVLDGSSKTTADFKGKVWLLNFWATSCTTCVAEMPEIISTYNKYQGRGYDTVAVAMSYDPPSYVVNFAQQRGLPFWVALDNTGELATETLTQRDIVARLKQHIPEKFFRKRTASDLLPVD